MNARKESPLLDKLLSDGVPSIPIIDIEHLNTVLNDDGSITNTVYYYYGGELLTLSSTVFLRSHTFN